MNPDLHQPLRSLLLQLTDMLAALPQNQYSQPVAVLNNASIGQHIRHVIELFEELFTGWETGTVNYDNRRRDYVLETNSNMAAQRLSAIAQQAIRHDKPLQLCSAHTNAKDSTVTVPTNYLRELIYNMEHTVHHMALIRIGIQAISVIRLPENFGVAASTIRYKNACAQ